MERMPSALLASLLKARRQSLVLRRWPPATNGQRPTTTKESFAMLVRLKIGRRAGEIQDIEPSAAKLMLADDRAEVIQYDQGSTEPEGVAKLAQVCHSEPVCHSEQREESAVACHSEQREESAVACHSEQREESAVACHSEQREESAVPESTKRAKAAKKK
jgi:hypothetical protein